MSERVINDAIGILKDIDVKLQDEARHWVDSNFLRNYKHFETLGCRLSDSLLFIPEAGADKLFYVPTIYPTERFREFMSYVYLQWREAYGSENWRYIEDVEDLIHIVDATVLSPMSNYYWALFSHGKELEDLKMDIDGDWKGYFDAWFEYADMLPLLSRIKTEHNKALSTPQESYLDYFSVLEPDNDWGIFSDIVLRDDGELRVLGVPEEDTVNKCISSAISSIAVKHNIELPKDYIDAITAETLPSNVYMLETYTLSFSLRDISFLLFVVAEVLAILRILDDIFNDDILREQIDRLSNARNELQKYSPRLFECKML